MIGQLLPQERSLLFDTVLKAQPKLVLEIGTWKGGGSTYQIASALFSTFSGVLHTCEVDPEFFAEAAEIYNTDKWRNIVFCHNIPSTQLINQLIANNTIPDFIFEDGPEDPALNIADLLLLEPHLKKGTIFAAHDWDLDLRVDGGISIKSQLIRPYIENSPKWRIVEYITKPISVGMVVAEFV